MPLIPIIDKVMIGRVRTYACPTTSTLKSAGITMRARKAIEVTRPDAASGEVIRIPVAMAQGIVATAVMRIRVNGS